MIKHYKKYKHHEGKYFYAVVYLSPNTDKTKCYLKLVDTLDNFDFNDNWAAYPIDRVDSIDLDYLTDPLVNGTTEPASRAEILEYLKQIYN